jgi:hypothetical protein
VQSGGVLSSCTPVTNPCRAAFEDYYGGQQGVSRYSWDPLSTYASVVGWEEASCEECSECEGNNSVDDVTGDNSWIYRYFSTKAY